jgi:chromosome segregation ATPase
VETETASLITAKSELEARVGVLESEKAATATELSEAKSRLDLLEADKSTAEAAAATARTELDEFKAEIARTAQIAELKTARQARVQTANANLATDFFSDERITRWAQMSEEAFDAFVTDMSEMAKPSQAGSTTVTVTEAARESAAFAGGTTPATGQGSTTSQLLGTRRAANR